MTEEALVADCDTRERRRAKVKLALVAMAAQRIEERPFDSISIKELCDAASIPEFSFYSYFSKKSEIIAYAVQLWNLEIQLRAGHAVQGRNGLARIGELFEQVARHVNGRPGLTGEMISHLAKQRASMELPVISPIEKQIAFPEFIGIDHVEPVLIDELLEFHLRYAVEHGELPRHTRVEAVASALASMFFGAPVAYRAKPTALEQNYRRQLNLVWLGVRGGVKPRTNTMPADNVPSLYHRRA